VELGTNTGTTTEDDEAAAGGVETPPDGVLTMIGGWDTTLDEEVATVDKVEEVSDPPMGASMPDGWAPGSKLEERTDDWPPEPSVGVALLVRRSEVEIVAGRERVTVTTTLTVSKTTSVLIRVLRARSSKAGIATAPAARPEARKTE
jgi:hypothetical protein